MPAPDDTGDRRTGIHLVPAPRLNERRLGLGEYTADIVISKREENCCYYVLQRVGSAEILDMQRFNSPEEAEAGAKRALKRWNGEDRSRQAAAD